MSIPPKYLLFVVNPSTKQILLANHRSVAVGANQWNGILCPSVSDVFDCNPSSMIVLEIFALTQSIYSPTDWSSWGCVSYDHCALECQILVSFTTDFNFVANAGGMDSSVLAADVEMLNSLNKSKMLAPHVKQIADHIFENLEDLGDWDPSEVA